MADRLKTFTSNLIRFAAGERPSADKFNAANEYLGRNIRDIFKAIGDMYGQGYPHLIDGETHLTAKWNPHQVGGDEGRALDIANLARLIGPASNLNPKQISGIQTINEIIPAGTNEHILKYNKTELLSIPNYTRIPTATDPFESSNQYKLIKNSILFAETTTEELSVTYFINSDSIQGGANYLYAGFNVIPDPNQASKLEIVVDPNDPTSYILNWSETTIEAQQSGLIDLNTTSTAGEWNEGKTATLPRWMWFGDDPLFTAGTIIPEGFLYVKNLTTNECYLSATYTFLSEFSIKISGVTLCLTDEYQIVTVGTDITTSIDDLRNKWFNHRHDGSFGEPRISVKDLVGKYLESADFEESSIADNDFPMYLHRKGYQEDSSRRNANNAMLGSLALGQIQYNEYDSLSKILYTNEDDAAEDNSAEEDPRLIRLSEKILFGSESTYIQERLGALYLQNTKQLREDIYNRVGGNLGYVPSILLKSESGSVQAQSRHVEIDSPTILLSNNLNLNEGEQFRQGSGIICNNLRKIIKEKTNINNECREYVSNFDNENFNLISNTYLNELPYNNNELNKDLFYISKEKYLFEFEKINFIEEKHYRNRKTNILKNHEEIFFHIPESIQIILDGNNVDSDLETLYESEFNLDSGSFNNKTKWPVLVSHVNEFINSLETSRQFLYIEKEFSYEEIPFGTQWVVEDFETNLRIEEPEDNVKFTLNTFHRDLHDNNYIGFFGNINITIRRPKINNISTGNLYLYSCENNNLLENSTRYINYILEYNSENNVYYRFEKLNESLNPVKTDYIKTDDGIINLNERIFLAGETDAFISTDTITTLTRNHEILFLIEEKIKDDYYFIDIKYDVLNFSLTPIP